MNPDIVGHELGGDAEGRHARLRDDQPRHRPSGLRPRGVAGGRGLAPDAEGLRHGPHVLRPGLHRRLRAGQPVGDHGVVGRLLYYKIWEDYPFEFVVPEEGALLWIDNMLIPANSANPQGAYQLMDFVYKPEIAQLITEWVPTCRRCPAVQDLIAEHADEASGSVRRRPARRRRRARSCGPTTRCSSERRSAGTSRPTRSARSGTPSSSRSRRPRVAQRPGQRARAPDGDRHGRGRVTSRRSERTSSWPSAGGASRTGCWRPARLPGARVHRPADPGRLHVAPERRPALRRVHVHLGVRQLRGAPSASTGSFYRASLVYSGARDAARASCSAYPMAYWIAFYGGQVEGHAVLPDPGAVLRVVRDPHGAVEVHPGRRRRALRPAEEPSGCCPTTSGCSRRRRGRGRHHVQLPAVHGAAALRRARAHRQAARRGGEGPLRHRRFEAFRKVVLPLSFPGLFAALILTFVPATGDYVNSSVLGSNRDDDDRPDHPARSS